MGREAVLRAYRGQGVGSRLLRHAIAAAQALGWGEVWVNAQMEVREPTTPAHRCLAGLRKPSRNAFSGQNAAPTRP
ncbi:GNAT family N-acetyltransferase [Thioalkalivibrio sp.]|uniref:GNAT family N-acetyltransferase n=1 Tax=Thioalkalivibrio sp. TaxID=2093813 RepID=UPI00345640CA